VRVRTSATGSAPCHHLSEPSRGRAAGRPAARRLSAAPTGASRSSNRPWGASRAPSEKGGAGLPDRSLGEPDEAWRLLEIAARLQGPTEGRRGFGSRGWGLWRPVPDRGSVRKSPTLKAAWVPRPVRSKRLRFRPMSRRSALFRPICDGGDLTGTGSDPVARKEIGLRASGGTRW
jgi:hypothetical protein